MKKIIIAIDGHSSCGKSTLGRALAAKLAYSFIDSGAMYRAVALYFQRHHVNVQDEKEVQQGLEHIHIDFIFNPALGKSETYLNGVNVEEEIRSLRVADDASKVSAISAVRRFLVAQQQQRGKQGGLIMDGRDIGTVVFPDAELKFYITASLEERVKRRMKELEAKRQNHTYEEVLKNLQERDHNDSTRADSPLRKANDALEIDTTFLSPEKQLEKAYELAIKAISSANET